jgi:Ca-activated chloride channel family protein
MDFANYRFLIYVLAAGTIALAFFVAYLFHRRRVLKGIVRDVRLRSTLLVYSPSVRAAKTVIVAACIILFCIAVLRPRWGETAREVRSEGVDVLFALDVSRSMLARDVLPSRLARAREAVRLVAGSPGIGRVGMVLFAGDAFLQCPLTEDIGAFMMFLDSAGADSVRRQGTDLGRALEEAEKVFKKKRMTTRMLVLLTDGEDHEGRAAGAARRLRDLGVAVHAIGIGTAAGAAVPLDEHADEYMRGGGGEAVTSAVDTAVLERIARETGGEHLDISADLSDVYRIIRLAGEQERLAHGSRVVKERVERYQLFVLVLVLLLSLEIMLPESRRFPSGERSGRIPAAPIAALLACLMFVSWIDPFRDEVREGNRLYKSGDHRGAEERYRGAERYAPRKKDRDRLRFNRGDARYMQGDLDGALEHFRGSLRSGDGETQKKALFNAGNVYLKKGDYRAAAGAYIDALKIDPEYTPAKKNLEYLMSVNRKERGDEGGAGNRAGTDEKDGGRTADVAAARNDTKERTPGERAHKGETISPEQARSLLESMKNKPVRRDRGTGDGRRELDRQW